MSEPLTGDRAGGRINVRLHELCHARTGDKGNRLNVSLIPYAPECFEAVREQVTEARVLELFSHRGATAVRRYELPNLPAFNFVIDDVLQGGVNGSLNLDGHGKSLSFVALSILVKVPQSVLDSARHARKGDNR